MARLDAGGPAAGREAPGAVPEKEEKNKSAAPEAMKEVVSCGARRALALLLMIASGFAGLGYQIVWTQQSALWLGHESAAVLAVVAGFFGGLAAGALLLGPRIDRSANPARWYAGCEAAIGVWSLALAFLLGPATNGLLELIGAQPSAARHWVAAFIGVFVLLLPATAPMGATLPAMERVVAGVKRDGSSIAILYAGNTFGAVLGVLVAAFVLVPGVGLRATAGVCAALNLLCAGVALTLATHIDNSAPLNSSVSSSRVLAVLAITGLLGIGYEVVVVRVLSQVAENTVYTFAILLAVYLIGTATGAAIYGRRGFDKNDERRVRDRLLLMLAVACMLGMLSLACAQGLKAWTLNVLGPSMAAALSAEAVIATAAFLLPTIAMGALFSHLTTSARASGISLGRALGVNTLGAALAPLLFGVLLIPAIGLKYALLIAVAAYLSMSQGRARWAALAAVVALAVWMPSLAIVDVPEGGHIVSVKEGSMATVSIVEDANGVSSLHIDNRQQEGSSATVYSDARQAMLPILLHPSPKRALFLGLGTGVTASAAATDPNLKVDVAELLPEVIEASDYFTKIVNLEPTTNRPNLMAADARRFVRATSTRYDVIISDNFHPARSGSGSLYTVEHFAAVKNRLAPGGLFCQWLPLHQLDLNTLRSIVRAFLTAYPNGAALLATNSLETPVIGLVGRADDQRIDVSAGHERVARAVSSQFSFGIDDELALFGSFIAGPRALARFSEHAPLNSDDHPVVAYRAPRITYAPDSAPRDRLLDLLKEVTIRPDELVTSQNEAWNARLAAYWSARNRFLQVGRNVQPSADVRIMLAQVREPLLSVLTISPDFRPAYDPLAKMAAALEQVDAQAAQELQEKLRDFRRPAPD